MHEANVTHGEQTRLWHAADLGGVELLHARYIQQRFAPHVHEGYVITVIESGAQRFRHRGVEHLAPEGSMVLINPDELHTGATAHEQGWRYRGFYPDLGKVTGVLDELELASNGLPAFADSVLHDPQVTRTFARLHQLLELNACALAQQTAWREAILLLFQRHARLGEVRQAGLEPWAVACARELLRSRLANPPSLEELAASVNLSPFHFARVFRRATGMPPYVWLKQQRLKQARELLKADCAPLQVALQLGFSDQSHLNRQFKQAYGVAPGEYRRAAAGMGLSVALYQ
ncbi:MAG: AraC family transcriptional regulator [Pseudomonas sp.]|uniref:AraC family transcriptional regulator n=1 Tax=Pseudomonas abieticivorans TaxID=2931382 RepID=UPI0020BFB8DB|nr:AraC family transcriptional regulator [Pseudomonas sp. PIA16]MDE1164739.1 AraC family transcriptional regulator [Pseudomonas sp.]